MHVCLYTGYEGQPPFDISEDEVCFLLDLHFSLPGIAELLGVSVSTIRRRMNAFGLSVAQTYAQLSDTALDSLVRTIAHQYPGAGIRMVQSHLLTHGYRVQQARVRNSLERVDPHGLAVRWSTYKSIHRRVL